MRLQLKCLFKISESVIVFNWNHFEMRLLNLRINSFFIFCGLFVLILVVFFVLFLLSLRFGQISPLAFFRWYGYKTQHSYSRSWLITWRRPEVKFGRNVVKEETAPNTTYQDEDKKSAINKKKINSHKWICICYAESCLYSFPTTSKWCCSKQKICYRLKILSGTKSFIHNVKRSWTVPVEQLQIPLSLKYLLNGKHSMYTFSSHDPNKKILEK